MQLLKMKGPHCLVYSAAMVLDCKPVELWDEIGHDGTEILYPDRSGLERYRGVHVQELIPSFRARGYSLEEIQPMPATRHYGTELIHNIYPDEQVAADRFYNLIAGHPGILIFPRHAMAWDGHGSVYDPNGHVTPIHALHSIITCHLRIKSA